MSTGNIKSWSGPNSQWSLNEINQMPLSLLIDNLINWKPEPIEFGPYASMEGTGRNIQEDVYKEPHRYIKDLHQFKKIEEPTYIRHLISGFRMASVNKLLFDWLPVLDLCEWVVEKNITEVPERNSDEVKSWNQDRDWNPTRHQIAMLLSSGLAQKTDEGGIPFDEREKVWKIIYRLIETSSEKEILNTEKDSSFSSSNYYELAINDSFTQSFEDSIQYALWVRRNLEKTKVKTSEQLSQEGLNNFEEVKNVLNQYLDLNQHPSYALHSIYGRWFPWLALLDRSWVELALPKIFPHESNLEKYWKVAWGSYIKNCNPYNLAFELLEPQYEKASYSLENNPSNEEREEKVEQEAWVEHVLVFYVRGLIPLKHRLMMQLFEKANQKLLAHAIHFLSVLLRNLKQSEVNESNKPVQKMQDLWEWRYPHANAAEKDEFMLWSESQWVDKNWLFTQLKQVLIQNYPEENDYRLIEAFVQLSKTFPEEVLNCLKLIAQHPSFGARIVWFQDHLPSLFKNILDSKKINSDKFLKVLEFCKEKVDSGIKERLESLFQRNH